MKDKFPAIFLYDTWKNVKNAYRYTTLWSTNLCTKSLLCIFAVIKSKLSGTYEKSICLWNVS